MLCVILWKENLRGKSSRVKEASNTHVNKRQRDRVHSSGKLWIPAIKKIFGRSSRG